METKDAWIGYAENNDTIVVEIDKGAEEIKKVKKRFNLQAAFEDLHKRQDILKSTKDGIMGLYNAIRHNVDVMSITIPDDKKKLIEKENKALTEKLEDIKLSSDKMAPEDRVARTMDLQEDIAAKFEVIKSNAEQELALLPQGDKVPADAQEFKDELNRIAKYVTDLQEKTKQECDKYSEDVKFWAEYRTGIKEFTPCLLNAENSSTDGLSKPSNLPEASAL